MAKFLKRQQLTPRQALQSKYSNSRANLLMIVIATIVNCILLISQSGYYFLFSAALPYILVDFGMYYCGKYPEEIYGGEYAYLEFLDSSFLAVMIALALIVVGLYFLSWILSKNRRVGWLIFALAFFSVDTILMFITYTIDSSMILDIIFHALIIVSLAMGISSYYKLKKLPEETVEVAQTNGEETTPIDVPDTMFIRYADMDVKARILLEYDAFGHKIVYRRIKRVNELVVDGRVYGEYIALIEVAHMLSANVGGHAIAVGYDGHTTSYVMVDGQVVAQKTRII